jgi:hypothetical protein
LRLQAHQHVRGSADDILWELAYAPSLGHPAQLSGRQEAVRHATWFAGAVENFRFFDLNIYALADMCKAQSPRSALDTSFLRTSLPDSLSSWTQCRRRGNALTYAQRHHWIDPRRATPWQITSHGRDYGQDDNCSKKCCRIIGCDTKQQTAHCSRESPGSKQS